MDYARSRRRVWAGWSTGIRLLVFALSASATITLGLADTDLPGKIGFVLSALVTSFSALEPFFNWRSRWVGADQAIALWYDLDEDLKAHVAKKPEGKLNTADIDEFYLRYRKVWNDWSSSWVTARKAKE